jgi:hypothetical protein
MPDVIQGISDGVEVAIAYLIWAVYLFIEAKCITLMQRPGSAPISELKSVLCHAECHSN